MGGGEGHPDHEIRGARSQKIFFRSLGSQFSLLTKDNEGCPRAPPWIRHCLVLQLSVKTNKFFEKIISVIHEENAKEI